MSSSFIDVEVDEFHEYNFLVDFKLKSVRMVTFTNTLTESSVIVSFNEVPDEVMQAFYRELREALK